MRFWVCIVATIVIGGLWTTLLELTSPDFPIRSSILIFLGSGLITWLVTSPKFFRRFVGEATPESLGIIRIITCGVSLILIIGIEDMPSSAWLPEGMRYPLGVIGLFEQLPGFDNFVRSYNSLQILDWLTGLVLFLGIIGWRTKIIIPLAFFCCLLVGGILRQYSHFFHTGLIPIYLLAILSFTPCGDGLSIDRLWKEYRGQAVPVLHRTAPVYGWSRYACWVVIAIPYVVAGLSKLRNGGLMWWGADNMRFQLYSTALAPMQFDFSLALHWNHAPDIVFALLGLFGVGSELAYGAVLFSRRARWIIPPLMAMMHIGILFFQDILFLDLILLQLIFVDFDQLRPALANWYASHQKPIIIIYDSLASTCCRNVRVLKFLDIFEQLQFQDFRQLDLDKYNDQHRLNLEEIALTDRINIISQDHCYRGFSGCKFIVLALPLCWILTPFIFLPGLSFLGEKLYQLSLSNPPSSAKKIANRELHAFWQGFGYPLLISIVTVGLISCWAAQLEFYPFTAMQMFSKGNTSGIVRYHKVLAHYDSGVIARSYLEKIIPALYDTRYRRTLRRCLSENPKDIQVCEELLTTAGIIYNNKHNTNDKIKQLEVQLWEWDFRKNPSDSQKGSMVQRRFIQVN